MSNEKRILKAKGMPIHWERLEVMLSALGKRLFKFESDDSRGKGWT